MFTKLRPENKISNIITILSASIYNAVILISATQQQVREVGTFQPIYVMD
jgi:hypothetical protein